MGTNIVHAVESREHANEERGLVFPAAHFPDTARQRNTRSARLPHGLHYHVITIIMAIIEKTRSPVIKLILVCGLDSAHEFLFRALDLLILQAGDELVGGFETSIQEP